MTVPDPEPLASGAAITLLVAGESRVSLAARANLAAIVVDQPDTVAVVRVVDVLDRPEFALRYHAFFTPTLIVETPETITRVVGDLYDAEQVKRLLARVVN